MQNKLVRAMFLTACSAVAWFSMIASSLRAEAKTPEGTKSSSAVPPQYDALFVKKLAADARPFGDAPAGALGGQLSALPIQ